MLMIRQEQLRLLAQAEVEKFEDWMLAHLKKFFPAQCQAAGDSKVRQMIRRGIERAAAHRITSRRDVCKYIDLMVVFGRDFDKDHRYPWAGKILAASVSSGRKVQELQRAARQHLRRS